MHIFIHGHVTFSRLDARLANSRRGRFRRHLNNQYGRSKRNNRFTHFYNKVYIPSNWSVSIGQMLCWNHGDCATIAEIDKLCCCFSLYRKHLMKRHHQMQMQIMQLSRMMANRSMALQR